MPEKEKHAHFLPAVQSNHSQLAEPSKKQQVAQSIFGQTRHLLRTEKEQSQLNQKAKEAALKGYGYTVEEHRKNGASLYAFARELGISNSLEYAEFLVKENPQAKNLVDELTLGFYVGNHIRSFRYFCEKYKASFNLLLEREAQNRYKRKTGVIYDVLLARLENACALEFQRKHGKKAVTPLDFDFSSSEESFTLSP